GVENDQGPVAQTHLDAGGVASVPDRFRTRRGERSPAPPDARLHPQRFASQKIATAPTKSFARAKRGKAVTSIARRSSSSPTIVILTCPGCSTRSARVIGRSSIGVALPSVL